jgi:predicted nucleic acid-binding protein
MPEINLFLDSSALFASIVSPDGAGRVLLLLGETGKVRLTISEQVVAETERALARKLPRALPEFRLAIRRSHVKIVPDPDPQSVFSCLDWMKDPADVPILLAAMQSGVDFLVTLNRKHFLDDPLVAQRAALRIGTPGDALAWLRRQLIPFQY